MSEHVSKQEVGIIVLAVIAICISMASAGFSAFVYLNTPHEVDTYVQAHRQELKGDKGDKGETGAQGLTGAAGRNGTSSYSSGLHCSSYSFSQYSSTTNCY